MISDAKMKTVTPAKAGVHGRAARTVEAWIPAFAGMTDRGVAS